MRVRWDEVESHWISDRTGQRREIKRLSLPARQRFVHLFNSASTTLGQEEGGNFRALYDRDSEFAQAITDMLQLFCLDIEWFDSAQAVQLLFKWSDGKGLLYQLEFPESDKPRSSVEDDGIDPYMGAIAALWSHMPNESFRGVTEIIESTPWHSLEGLLEAKSALSKPGRKLQTTKDSDEEDFEPDLDLLAQEFNKSIRDGSMFGFPGG